MTVGVVPTITRHSMLPAVLSICIPPLPVSTIVELAAPEVGSRPRSCMPSFSVEVVVPTERLGGALLKIVSAELDEVAEAVEVAR